MILKGAMVTNEEIYRLFVKYSVEINMLSNFDINVGITVSIN